MQKVLGVAFIFGFVPLGTGLLYGPGMRGKRHFLAIYLAGFLTQWAAFELLAVPIMIRLPLGMDVLTQVAFWLLGLLALVGILTALWENRKKRRKFSELLGLSDVVNRLGTRAIAGKSAKKDGWERGMYWLLALGAVGIQVYMSYAYAAFDGDDAYYVVQSVLAQETGSLNRILPYTGLTTTLDVRHCLATLPLWEAWVGRLTGIHATIVAHTLLPLFLIPLTYIGFYLIGCKIPGLTGHKLPIFLFLVSILQIWGDTSRYTNANFFLMRTWQGKSILANLIVLAVLWLLLEIVSQEKKGGSYWVLLAVTNVAAAMMTSMGVFLTALLIGVVGLAGALRLRKLSLVVGLAACCLPNLFYLTLLVVLPSFAA